MSENLSTGTTSGQESGKNTEPYALQGAYWTRTQGMQLILEDGMNILVSERLKAANGRTTADGIRFIFYKENQTNTLERTGILVVDNAGDVSGDEVLDPRRLFATLNTIDPTAVIGFGVDRDLVSEELQVLLIELMIARANRILPNLK